MHLIIKRPYLERIKSYLQVIAKEYSEDNILIKASKNSIILFLTSAKASSDIRIELVLNAYLDIKETGEVWINTKILSNLLNKLDISKDLEVYRADKNYLQFFSGSYKCDLFLVNKKNEKDKNLSKEIANLTPIVIPYETLRESYFHLKDFCQKTDKKMRPELKNIHFRKSKDSSVLEAWGSNSEVTICGEFKLNTEDEFKMNIRPSTMTLLIGLYAKQSSVNLYLFDTDKGLFLMCSREGCVIRTKLESTPYPSSFFQYFNMSDEVVFRLSKKELLNLIDRNVLVFDKEKENQSSRTLYKVEGGNLQIEHEQNDRGKCKETIEIKVANELKLEFCLRSGPLKDLIKAIDSEEIIFKVSDPQKPIIVLSSLESNFKQCISPVSKNV